MTTYTSTNELFQYTITNNTSYVMDSSDNEIIADVFNHWDSIVTPDSRFTSTYTIEISFDIDRLDTGVLGGASVQTVYYFGSMSYGNTYPATATITMNDLYISSMKSNVRTSGKTEYYYVLLHEVGHVFGIGSFWNLTNTPKLSYVEDGETKYYYTGTHAVREYKSYMPAIADKILGIPIEDDGSAGTINVHPEEGHEGTISIDSRYINGVFHPGLDTELMTGWIDSSPVDTPLSRITLGFLEDMGYGVNYNLADYYRTMSEWLDLSNNANCFESSYIKGFVDISGGSLQLRNADNHLLVGGDASFNGGVYLGEKKLGDSDVVESLSFTGTINQLGQDIDGEAEGDYFGGSVSLSSDGTIVAIGAPWNEGTGV